MRRRRRRIQLSVPRIGEEPKLYSFPPSVGVPRHIKFAAKFWQTERAQCIPGTLCLSFLFQGRPNNILPFKNREHRIEGRWDGKYKCILGSGVEREREDATFWRLLLLLLFPDGELWRLEKVHGGGRRRRKICSDGAGGEGRGRREFYVAFSVFFFLLVGTRGGGFPRAIYRNKKLYFYPSPSIGTYFICRESQRRGSIFSTVHTTIHRAKRGKKRKLQFAE